MTKIVHVYYDAKEVKLHFDPKLRMFVAQLPDGKIIQSKTAKTTKEYLEKLGYLLTSWAEGGPYYFRKER